MKKAIEAIAKTNNVKPTVKKRGGRVDPLKALELRAKGVRQTDIAEMMGVSSAAVCQQLSRVEAMLAPQAELEQYRAKQAEVMDSIAIEYGARLLNPDAIKGASALQAASVLGIVTDKARLIRGESTSNSLVLHANAAQLAAESWGSGHRGDPSAIGAESANIVVGILDRDSN